MAALKAVTGLLISTLGKIQCLIMQTLVLVGSGEFTQAMEGVDRYLLSLIGNSPTVAILPTAAGMEKHPEKWVEDGVRHFKKLGAKPFGVMVLEKPDAYRKELISKLNDVSLIYFSGGHPGYLYTILKDSPLWQTILKKYDSGQVILVGASAGAMVMGRHMLGNAQEVFFKAEKPHWSKAFGLVPYCILPHFDAAMKDHPEIVKKVIDTTPKNLKTNLTGIDEDTAVILKDKEIQVLGKGTVHFHLHLHR